MPDETRTAEDDAWTTFINAAKAWANHLDQWNKVKFQTDDGTVYVTIGREDPHPDTFEEV